MLLAYQAGATLLVAVGTRFSLIEFLDKRRSGMASTFLTRLKVGSLLVDAKGVSRLYQPAFSARHLLLLVVSAACRCWRSPCTRRRSSAGSRSPGW